MAHPTDPICRWVIDTNVLLDIFIFQDPATAPLREALFSGELLAVRSQRTLDEFASVIAREKFGIDTQRQQAIVSQWASMSSCLNDADIAPSRWKCKDRDDQVFLDLAFTVRPAVLLSKDLQVLKFCKRAAKEGVVIANDFSLAQALQRRAVAPSAVPTHVQADQPSGCSENRGSR